MSHGVQSAPESSREAEDPPGLLALFAAFSKISLTSFGGGLSGWMLREFVGRRAWVTEDEFLSGLALAQAFPGVNVVNLSIWIGYRLRGAAGALASVGGMVLPALAVAIAVVALFGTVADQPEARRVLAGVGAAAIGLSLQTGLRSARRSLRSPAPALIMACTFVAVGLFHLPLIPVMAVAAPASIAVAAIRARRG